VSAPLLIAHRGASGSLPEHTLAAYSLAILQGADFIEPDLVATRDGVLVARHENEIGATTDVAQHEEFASRRRQQHIDGVLVEGWFTEDFTLAELRRLRVRERIAHLRPQNARHDGEFLIPTFQEILQLLTQVNAGRRVRGLAPVGVYPETKHPSHFASLGMPLEPLLLGALADGANDAPVYIQSFEVSNLEALRTQCAYPLVQLMAVEGGPWDRAVSGERASYQDMTTPEGLRGIARYAAAIGVQKEMVLLPQADGRLVPTALVHDAHAAGLAVHVWTFRAENHFLPVALRRGTDPAAPGDLDAEIGAFREAGVDGLFCDQPGLAHAALRSVITRS
jgi:glycerophosphoryl diester phosphodiesterase